MKKLIALVVFALSAACTTSTDTTNKTTATNANVAVERKSLAMSDAEAIEKEREAWDFVRKKDFDGFSKVMAGDGIYVSHHGVLDPNGTIKETSELDLTDLSFSDWKVLAIDKEALLVTYTAHVQGRIEGQPLVATSIRCSTAWINREGNWLAIYHQDSEAKPAATPGSNRQPPTQSPNPSPDSLTGSDPIADEKIIWDALKNRNFDAFAALLAPDSLEVEPEGVFDKTGSVMGVRQTDFSKATLSDFKAVKIDEDAALVTYMVKIPGTAPEGEHHTTIWVNRSGKWLALFHQGTPVLKTVQPVSPKASKPAGKPARY